MILYNVAVLVRWYNGINFDISVTNNFEEFEIVRYDYHQILGKIYEQKSTII